MQYILHYDIIKIVKTCVVQLKEVKNLVNTELIRNRMGQLDLKEEYLADKLKLAQSSLNLKINNKRSFTIEEMFTMAQVLEIEDSNLREFFLI